MKQRYPLKIADMELTVVSDSAPEVVEMIEGILDRKMREVYMHNHCSKANAALICALETLEDRMKQKDYIAELEDIRDAYEADRAATEAAVAELAALRAQVAEQSAELERLQKDNEFLRTVLSRSGQIEEPIAPDPVSPHEFLADVAAAQSGAEEASEASAPVEPTPEPEPAPAPVESARSRSRVGSMFDLLSFGEVD